MMAGGVNKMVAMIGGAVLALVGILGFFAAPDGALLGIFDVNLLHNIVHLGSGLVLLAAAFINNGASSRITLLVLGAVYALVTIVGFVAADFTEELLGDTTNSITLMPDNILHLLLAIVFIAVPLVVREDVRRPMTGSPRV